MRIAIGEADAGFEIRRAVAGADGDHVLDAGGEGALDDGVAVGVELVAVQVAVGVDEHVKISAADTTPMQPISGARRWGRLRGSSTSDGLPPSQRRGHDHALRFDASQFARGADSRRSRLCGRPALPACRPRDAGDDAARLAARRCRRAGAAACRTFDGLAASLHDADAQIDFHEIVDGDVGVVPGCRRRATVLPNNGLLARVFFDFELPHLFDGELWRRRAGRRPLTAPSIWPAGRWPQCRSAVRMSVDGRA